jgi:hypothetical protein
MITFLKEVCEDHIREKHPEWILDQSRESGLKSSAAGLSPVSSAQKRFAEDDEDDEESETSTRYNNPDWLKTTKNNFNKLVIEKCSYKVRQCVENNEQISSIVKKKEVRKEIIDATLQHILEIFGGVNRPLIAEMREIVFEMSFQYPALFKQDDTVGYGLGGSKGVSGLANQMLDKFRKKQLATRTIGSANHEGADVVMPAPRPKGKKTLLYGNFKFWDDCFKIKHV